MHERLGLVLAEHGGEFGAQRVAVGDAVLVAGKARIGAEFGLADFLGELAEGAVIADADEDVVGPGREDRVGHEIGMLVAGQARRLAVHEIIRGVRMHDGEAGLVQRGFEKLAEAGALPLRQRHQDADRGVKPGGDVDQRNADPHRAALRRAGRRDHAGHGLDDGVIAGIAAARAVGAEAGNPAMHQLRKFRAQHVVADAPFVERARLEILDQDVGGLQHLHQHGAAALGGEVEPDRALVAVDADEIGRVLLVERRAPVAHLVAGRRLDLDDVGAVVGEDLRAIGAAEHARQIDHAQAGHCAGSGLRTHGNNLRSRMKWNPELAVFRRGGNGVLRAQAHDAQPARENGPPR